MRIGSVVIRCRRFDAMRAFWQSALHYVPGDPATAAGWIVLTDPKAQGPNISLPPRDKPATTRGWIHLDLYTPRQRDEVDRLIALGANRYRWRYRQDDDFVVLQDPDGNLLCVVQHGS
jgi:catechol 2,3-dioxygenase-like lactoylglutathione lyase family enzyme